MGSLDLLTHQTSHQLWVTGSIHVHVDGTCQEGLRFLPCFLAHNLSVYPGISGFFSLSLSFLEEKEKIPQSTLGSFGVVLHKTPDLALVAGQPGLEGGKDMAIYEKVLCLYIIAASNANGGVCL